MCAQSPSDQCDLTVSHLSMHDTQQREADKQAKNNAVKVASNSPFELSRELITTSTTRKQQKKPSGAKVPKRPKAKTSQRKLQPPKMRKQLEMQP